MKKFNFILFHHHHHHVVLVARISLTLSRHFSLSFIASGWSSGQHPISSHSCRMYVRAGRPAFARPCVGVHKSTSLMSSSLLLQQCPACLSSNILKLFKLLLKILELFFQKLCWNIQKIILNYWILFFFLKRQIHTLNIFMHNFKLQMLSFFFSFFLSFSISPRVFYWFFYLNFDSRDPF